MNKIVLSSLAFALPLAAVAQFPDVPATHAHASAVIFVKDQGIVDGYPDGTFRPDAQINRAEFTKIMIESAFKASVVNRCDTAAIGLSDVGASEWFAKYVCVAKENGVVGGYPDGTFKGGNNVNFAEGAKIVLETFNMAQCEALSRATYPADAPWYTPYLICADSLGLNPRVSISAGDNLTRGEMAAMIYAIKGKNTTTTAEAPAPIIAADLTVTAAAPMYKDYDAALYKSLRASNTPFVLNLSASWCPNCKALDKRLREGINDLPAGTMILQADYDAETALKQEFGVTRQTSGVLFAADGSTETLNGRLSYSAIEDFFAAQ